MEDLNFSLFWAIVVPSFFIWAAGAYMIIKSWSERPEPVSFGPAIGQKAAAAPVIEKEAGSPVKDKKPEPTETASPAVQEI